MKIITKLAAKSFLAYTARREFPLASPNGQQILTRAWPATGLVLMAHRDQRTGPGTISVDLESLTGCMLCPTLATSPSTSNGEDLQ